MPYLDSLNDLFDESRSEILSEITDMITSAYGILLSTNYVRGLSWNGNGGEVEFKVTCTRSKHVNESNKKCEVELCLRKHAMILWIGTEVGKCMMGKVSRIQKIREGRNELMEVDKFLVARQ